MYNDINTCLSKKKIACEFKIIAFARNSLFFVDSPAMGNDAFITAIFILPFGVGYSWVSAPNPDAVVGSRGARWWAPISTHWLLPGPAPTGL